MNVGWPYLQDCHLTHRITELTKADQRKPLALLEKKILMACQSDRRMLESVNTRFKEEQLTAFKVTFFFSYSVLLGAVLP